MEMPFWYQDEVAKVIRYRIFCNRAFFATEPYLFAVASRLLAAMGHTARAAALASYVADHPVSWKQARALAKPLVHEAGSASALAGDVWEVLTSLEDELSLPQQASAAGAKQTQ